MRILVFPNPCQHLVSYRIVLITTHPVGYVMVSVCGFNLYFPNNQGDEASFHVLIDHL